MKTILLAMSMISVVAVAQTVDYNKVVLPSQVTPDDFSEKLVQLAWKNHPSNKIVQQNVEVAQLEKSKVKWSWLDNIYAVGNINEFTIDPSTNENQYFYPRYNFGIRVTLGDFVLTPLGTSIAGKKIEIANEQIKRQKLAIREDVLNALNNFRSDYILKEVQLKRKELLRDLRDTYVIAEEQFKENKITYSSYVATAQIYNNNSNAIIRDIINAEQAFNKSKILLEQLIGVSLEEVASYQEYLRDLQNDVRKVMVGE